METENEILVNYLDQQLSQEESVRIENALHSDPDLNRNLLYLKLAVDTVRLDAINQKVVNIRRSLEKDQIVRSANPAIVRNMYKITLRVAAIIVLFLCAASVYKYVSFSTQGFYNKQFTGYELGNTRGQQVVDAETEAYRNGNWREVISIYNTGLTKSNQKSFLAAMAEMQLNHFPSAISRFENLLSSGTGGNAYHEESEYFLSLAYIMNRQGVKAVQMINKIKANPSHLYYPIVSKYSSIDLKIIELKNN